jgi:hypothetical protein
MYAVLSHRGKNTMTMNVATKMKLAHSTVAIACTTSSNTRMLAAGAFIPSFLLMQNQYDMHVETVWPDNFSHASFRCDAILLVINRQTYDELKMQPCFIYILQ